MQSVGELDALHPAGGGRARRYRTGSEVDSEQREDYRYHADGDDAGDEAARQLRGRGGQRRGLRPYDVEWTRIGQEILP